MKHLIAGSPEADDEVAGWMAEAGDPRVEPRPEHLEHVREVLFERLAIPPRRVARRWIMLSRCLVATTGLLLVGLMLAILPLARPGNAWARITRAVQEKRWIHVVTRIEGRVLSESWTSPRYELLAVKYDQGPEGRSVEYHDLKAGIKTLYIEAENTIYRVAEGSEMQGRHAREDEFFRQLRAAGRLETAPMSGTEIVEQASRDITEAGKTWRQHELTIRWKEGRKSVVRMVIRVDPATGLPRTWDVVSTEGTLQSTLDYPETGPADILAMGVPATARRVDRVPSDDLNRVLAGLKLGRNRFDDYCGFCWSDGTTTADVIRIWRKGRKWRVERAYPRRLAKAPFDEIERPTAGRSLVAELGFWKLHEAGMYFELMALCDGETIHFYRYKAKTFGPDEPYFSELTSVTTQTVGSADNPFIPWPELMPEQIAHPNIDVPTPQRVFSIDSRPVDGPPGTVRISVRDNESAEGKRPDLYRLWIDPDKNHMAMRAETSVFDSNSPRTRDGIYTKIAYVDSRILADLDRSPGGFWYPTRVIRKTSNYPGQQVTRFVLDFRAEIPDALFRPAE